MTKDSAKIITAYQKIVNAAGTVDNAATLKRIWIKAMELGKHQPPEVRKKLGNLAANISHTSELQAIRGYSSELNECWNQLGTFFSEHKDSDVLWENLNKNIRAINVAVLDNRIKNVYIKNRLPKKVAIKIAQAFYRHNRKGGGEHRPS